MRIQFVHIPHGTHPRMGFGNPGVVPQASGAPVSGAGGDLSESIAQVVLP